MMELNRDDHMHPDVRHDYSEEVQLDSGDRSVRPALAHKRAGDPHFLILVPTCPLCEAAQLAQAEAWQAVKEAAAAFNAERTLTDGEE